MSDKKKDDDHHLGGSLGPLGGITPDYGAILFPCMFFVALVVISALAIAIKG